MTRNQFPGRSATPELENQRLRQRLRELAAEANHNEEVLQRFQERELSLLCSDDLGQLLERLTLGMQRSFNLPCISLLLHDPDHEYRHLLLNSGRPPESFDHVIFVDSMSDYSPTYDHLTRPLLGPFQSDQHAMLFPGCRLLRSVALLPMIRRSSLVGGLNLGSGDPARFTRHHACDFLYRMATIAAVCLESTASREHLVISGLTDALTGLHNRRYLQRRLDEEVARAHRYRQPLSCLFIDADHFKRINDLHGHAAGDRVLREISLRVRECLRASDIATRYGGEEFALLLPQTDLREGLQLAERIRAHVGGTPLPLGNDSGELQVTVSIGVSELTRQSDKQGGDQLIEMADKALYQAKELGRDRVIPYRPAGSASVCTD